MGLPQDLKNAQMWPIKAKGKVQRLDFAGDPKVEAIYHKALEPGRHLESSLGDANNLLAERKREVLARIALLLDVNKVAVNAQNKRRLRKILLAANSISFLKEVNQFQQEITDLGKALTSNIGQLQTMEQNMFRMVQANLNAVANLLHDICNWGLPDLPAIPNLFSDTIWNWNGFNFFPLAAFQPHIGFDKNFAFNQCVIHIPNINIFRNYPSTVQTYSDLQYGTPAFVPPLGGLIPNTGQNLSDPNFITQMQNTNTDPVYGPTFNKNSSMLGSIPDPNTIIDNYQMPSGTYRDNIVSIVPQLRGNVVEPGDADYANPNLVTRSPILRGDLIHFVTLRQVVASGFEPNLTAAWLFYLDNARTGRGGVWVKNFQDMYDATLAPSIVYLEQTPIPWNNVLPGGAISNGPTAIPFIGAAVGAANQTNLLWRLSFIEAAILGYTRTKDWDLGADPGYVGDFTKTDLDYQATPIDSTVTTMISLGANTATFPTSCTFPSAIAAVLQQVIDKAATDIKNTLAFRSPHPQFRFTYSSFAQATEVDRFSQFWREFNANLQLLLIQDPYLVGFTVTYKESLDSAVNPLGDPAIYDTLKTDAASRNRAWTPGTPLLKIPVAPIVAFSSDVLPTDANNGWQGLDLDPVAFLARPDIQSQPIPVQIAMLRTNLSFAAISKFRDEMSNEFDTQIADAKAAMASGNAGFEVEVVKDTPQSVPSGPAGLQIAFDTIVFDITGNVNLPLPSNTFTIQQAGSYAVAGNINWGAGASGTRTVTVFKNGNPFFTTSTDVGTGLTSLPFSTVDQFEQGDVVTVVATHSLGTDQSVAVDSFFEMVNFETDVLAGGVITDNGGGTKTFIAGADFPAMTVVRIAEISSAAEGEVIPVDPVNVAQDGGNTVFPFADGIALEPGVTGNPVTVATNYGALFQVLGQNLAVGGLLYAGPNGLVTQDYATLITEVQWVICVGRAFDADTFLWEPHVPQRFNMTF
jgi:hypothetical protein